MDGIGKTFASVLGLHSQPKDKKEARFPGTIAPLRSRLKPDTYMNRLKVKDHINPIWERESDELAISDIEDEAISLEYSYNLPKFIERSSIVTDESASSYEDDISRISVSEIDESEIRGVYLDEIQWNHATPLILDSEYHYVYLRGLPVHGETLECVDMSPYSDQFKITLYEWFIGTDCNFMDRYMPEAIALGKSFEVPLEAIGKYVFCRAHRKIELQIPEYRSESCVGVYDPHVASTQTKYTREPQYRDISTWCSTGPVDIRNEWILQLLENLSKKVYQTDADLCLNSGISSDTIYQSANVFGECERVRLTISYDGISILCESNDHENYFLGLLENTEHRGSSNELKLMFGDFMVEISHISDQELVIRTHNSGSKSNNFALKFKNTVQCIFVLCTLRCFMAHETILSELGDWPQKSEDCDMDCARRLFRECLYVV